MIRPFLSLALAAVVAFALAACGGSDEEAGSPADVDRLLEETFAGDHRIESGRVDLSLRIDARQKGAGSLGGPVTVRLAGPFASQGDGRVPRFAMEARLQGGGQTVQAGATSTGDAAFVSFEGQAYAVAEPVFRQFRAGYEEAQKRARDGGGQSFASLGMDPRRWLEDARTDGEAKVGDADTVRITGSVDVRALLDDIDRALAKARSLGLEGAARLPERLTQEQRRQVEAAVKRLDVVIYTGKDDRILRRITVDLRVADEQAGSGALVLDLTFTEVNEDQEIEAPSDPRPFGELVDRLRGLGLALGLGGGSGSGGGGAGSGAALEAYADCVNEAAGDAAAARECADLLAP